MPHRALPLVVEHLDAGLDECAIRQLSFILDLPTISTALANALLDRRRVFVVVDSISEMKGDVSAHVHPTKGAQHTHAYIVTSRVPTLIPGELAVSPDPVGLGEVDTVLSGLISTIGGSDRFTADDREAVRTRFKTLLGSDSTRDTRAMPMLFLKLLVQRADTLLGSEGSLDRLPASFVTLVDEWVAELLRDPDDILAARQAALAAVIPEFAPAWRSRAKYLRTVEGERLDRLVISGLIEKSGLQSDPLYKFALDPISEYLAALEIAIETRDATLEPAVAACLATTTLDDIPAPFRKALDESAAHLGITVSLAI